MKRAVLIAALAAGALASAACADGKQSSSNTGPEKSSLPSPGGNGNNGTASTGANVANAANTNGATVQNNFYTSAARGGMAEVEMSKLAQTKATNPEVKKFAQMMVSDHTKANTELKSLAKAKSVALPAELSSSHAAVFDELKGLSGADFDRTYVSEMVEDHEADVQLFEDQAKDDSDPEAKAFAASTLPTLRKHLEMIQGIQSRLQ